MNKKDVKLQNASVIMNCDAKGNKWLTVTKASAKEYKNINIIVTDGQIDLLIELLESFRGKCE